jgi:uncharacterized membrane protein
MGKASEVKTLFRVGLVAAFATLAFAGTLVIRVPLPVTGGYFNLGDTFVMAAGLLYGPLVGALVGMIGPALADAVGFPQFILATAIIKFCEGGLVGLIGWSDKSDPTNRRPLLAVILGVLVLVGGYFVFEAFVYPLLAKSIPFFAVTDLKAAIAEIVPNLLQGGISAVIALGILRVFHRPE